MRAVDVNNVEIKKGQFVTSFRGEVWEFISATRLTDEAHAGKVHVKSPGLDYGDREFYATVFNLTVQE